MDITIEERTLSRVFVVPSKVATFAANAGVFVVPSKCCRDSDERWSFLANLGRSYDVGMLGLASLRRGRWAVAARHVHMRARYFLGLFICRAVAAILANLPEWVHFA